MEARERIIELFLGLILVVFLVIMVLFFAAKPVSSESEVVTNSYNINSYNQQDVTEKVVTSSCVNCVKGCTDYEVYDGKKYCDYSQKPVVVYDHSYEKHSYQEYHNINTLSYTAHKTSEEYCGVFGNSVTKYVVVVKNTDSESGYFTVGFEFKTYSGDVWEEHVMKYLRPGEEEVFTYLDVYGFDYDKNGAWSYTVDAPEKDNYKVSYSTNPVNKKVYTTTTKSCYYGC